MVRPDRAPRHHRHKPYRMVFFALTTPEVYGKFHITSRRIVWMIGHLIYWCENSISSSRPALILRTFLFQLTSNQTKQTQFPIATYDSLFFSWLRILPHQSPANAIKNATFKNSLRSGYQTKGYSSGIHSLCFHSKDTNFGRNLWKCSLIMKELGRWTPLVGPSMMNTINFLGPPCDIRIWVGF